MSCSLDFLKEKIFTSKTLFLFLFRLFIMDKFVLFSGQFLFDSVLRFWMIASRINKNILGKVILSRGFVRLHKILFSFAKCSFTAVFPCFLLFYEIMSVANCLCRNLLLSGLSTNDHGFFEVQGFSYSRSFPEKSLIFLVLARISLRFG